MSGLRIWGDQRPPNPLPDKIAIARKNDRAAEGKTKKTPETNLMIGACGGAGPGSPRSAIRRTRTHLRAVAFAKSEKEPKRDAKRGIDAQATMYV